MVLWIMLIFFFHPSPVGAAPIVNTDRDSYRSGEKIKVHFSNSPGNNGDWICIVPAGSPDTEAGDYQYMPKGLSQGVLTFESPSPGRYEARAYYNYRRNGYAVSARHGFSVADHLPPVESSITPPAVPRTGAEKTTTMAKPSVTATPGGASRHSAAVFHFKPVNMDASGYGITVTNTLINASRVQASFVMMDRKDLETFLVANNLQQNDQIENAIKIGTKLGINFVIAGSVEKRGTMIVTNCKVIGIGQRKLVFTQKSMSVGEGNLVSDMIKMSDAMVEAVLKLKPQ